MATSSARGSLLAALAGAGLLASGPAQPQLTPVFVIPTESRVAAPVPAGEPLALGLEGRDLGAIARALRVPPPPAGASRLDYVLAGYPVAVTSLEQSWLEPSFVIDFDEPSVQALRTALQREAGEAPARAELLRFVAQTIDETRPRGWDVASRVAALRQGDCTEHAVLTTALARSLGQPARVVLGVALVFVDGRYAAYGHAWSELLADGHWVVADAALAATAAPVRYLPLAVLEQEGPGFIVAAAPYLQGWVQRITVAPTDAAR
jgi:transglutaminase-like putative cysteine protease